LTLRRLQIALCLVMVVVGVIRLLTGNLLGAVVPFVLAAVFASIALDYPVVSRLRQIGRCCAAPCGAGRIPSSHETPGWWELSPLAGVSGPEHRFTPRAVTVECLCFFQAARGVVLAGDRSRRRDHATTRDARSGCRHHRTRCSGCPAVIVVPSDARGPGAKAVARAAEKAMVLQLSASPGVEASSAVGKRAKLLQRCVKDEECLRK